MRPLFIVGQVMGGMRPASAAIEAEFSLKVWEVLHGTLRWASRRRLMGRVRPASQTSEAIEVERGERRWGVVEILLSDQNIEF